MNIAKVAELTAQGRMRPEGLAAFQRRTEDNSRIYSHERTDAVFSAEQEEVLRSDKSAWENFQAQPASYRRAATWWVISAKRQETRERRLAQLVEHSAAGTRLPHLSR